MCSGISNALKIYFQGEIDELLEDINLLTDEYSFEVDKGGFVVNVRKGKGSTVLAMQSPNQRQ